MCLAGQLITVRHSPSTTRSLPFFPLSHLARVLSKTLAYLQTKRADLEPKPGFMRQLVALDNSLQRVARAAARGKDDPALRKCIEWDPALVLGTPSSPEATAASRPHSTCHF